MEYDRTVHTDDTRSLGDTDKCFYCGSPIGDKHRDNCVIVWERKFEAHPIGEWFPIETYMPGFFVLFWFPNHERGNGGREAAMAFPDEDGIIRHGWSEGGAGSGSDFEFPEPPTHWSRLIEGPR